LPEHALSSNAAAQTAVKALSWPLSFVAGGQVVDASHGVSMEDLFLMGVNERRCT
jgi:hypothetical protein